MATTTIAAFVQSAVRSYFKSGIFFRMLSKLLFCKLYSADFAVGYQPDINPFTEMPIQEWNLPDIVSRPHQFFTVLSTQLIFSIRYWNNIYSPFLTRILRSLYFLQILNAPAGGSDPVWAPFDQEKQVSLPDSPHLCFSGGSLSLHVFHTAIPILRAQAPPPSAIAVGDNLLTSHSFSVPILSFDCSHFIEIMRASRTTLSLIRPCSSRAAVLRPHGQGLDLRQQRPQRRRPARPALNGAAIPIRAAHPTGGRRSFHPTRARHAAAPCPRAGGARARPRRLRLLLPQRQCVTGGDAARRE
jgi:hypothetical protein